MRFLIQIPQLIFAGAEKVLVNFANELIARGHEVEILEIYDRGYLKPQFNKKVKFNCICSKEYTQKYYASLDEIRNTKSILLKIQKCGKLLFSKIVGYRKFAEKLAVKYYKNKQYDVAINYLETEPPEFLLNHIHANKYIQWYHTDVANLEDPENTDKMIHFYEKMDAIICVAKSAQKSFVERYPQLADKTHVIYNFFDVESIRKKAAEPFTYSEAKDGTPVLLSVGRMTPPKKYIRFLNVLHRLKSDGFQFQWYVLGDGIERTEIEKKIKECGLSDSVFLEGLTDNPYKYMKHCDLFVLPSGYEGFPTVTVEAKILGCPVLATDVSGIREQMEHGKTGWIVENNEDAIFEGLKYLLEHSEKVSAIRSNDGIDKICDSENKIRKIEKLIDFPENLFV